WRRIAASFFWVLAPALLSVTCWRIDGAGPAERETVPCGSRVSSKALCGCRPPWLSPRWGCRTFFHYAMKTQSTNLLLAVVVLLGVAGCGRPQSAGSFINLESSPNAVRDRFNADVGKVRVVMLVAPT